MAFALTGDCALAALLANGNAPTAFDGALRKIVGRMWTSATNWRDALTNRNQFDSQSYRVVVGHKVHFLLRIEGLRSRSDLLSPQSWGCKRQLYSVKYFAVITLVLKIRAFFQILRYFRNPLLVMLMRFGLLRVPFFTYVVRQGSGDVTMLARPANVSMGDLFVLREIFVEETYRDLLPLLPSKAVTVVDVGANLGSFTIWLTRRHGVAAAFCFEPEPTSFELCRFNLARNCRNAESFPSAIGGIQRRISISGDQKRPGGNSIYGPPSGSDAVEVDVIALPEWLQKHDGMIDVLKLDCEGAEWEIIDAMTEKEFRRISIVVAEVHNDPRGHHDVNEFQRLMEQRGFRTRRWDGHCYGVYIATRNDP